MENAAENGVACIGAVYSSLYGMPLIKSPSLGLALGSLRLAKPRAEDGFDIRYR